ncbi:unnamed protein product [Cochlearia groenlandica]
MVVDYMEESDDEQQQCIGRNLCNCFYGEEEDEEFFTNRVIRKIKSLVACAKSSEGEKNLVTKTTEIVEKDKMYMRRDDSRLETLVDELVAIG